ncbi:MAG: DUF72 domain-containing protein [Desulfotomaculales bacterium]
MPGIYIGTSGYNYPHWRGRFYPAGVPSRRWLEHYATCFNTVELNVTFYRLPEAKTFAAWRARTPAGFVVALKGSRLVTHLKRLENVDEALANFFAAAGGLKEKLGVVLWQLPPGLQADAPRLAVFCQLLQADTVARHVRHAFEFRHASWFVPEVYAILRGHNFALCIADAPRWPSGDEVTAGFVYLRFHGGTKLYASRYTPEELASWARRIAAWVREGRDIYAYFNNDAEGHAVANAGELRALVESTMT